MGDPGTGLLACSDPGMAADILGYKELNRFLHLEKMGSWRLTGVPALPLPDHHSRKDLEFILREDMFLLSLGNWEKIIDVGWYPEGEVETGAYIVRVVESGGHESWDNPLEEFTSQNPHAVLQWVRERLVRHER